MKRNVIRMKKVQAIIRSESMVCVSTIERECSIATLDKDEKVTF